MGKLREIGEFRHSSHCCCPFLEYGGKHSTSGGERPDIVRPKGRLQKPHSDSRPVEFSKRRGLVSSDLLPGQEPSDSQS